MSMHKIKYRIVYNRKKVLNKKRRSTYPDRSIP